MEDLLDLGLLLPMGYAAPDVQSVLSGDLLDSTCGTPGSSPDATCGSGTGPTSVCRPRGKR